ncbi:hypothetical protein [Nocardia donostiensis]|uniref:Uncharacterized protein n=1 Tax=Nocardia donostiensis TaxID=1538463 RepID=A0A1V2TF89_9NOCA|nr:hypothetical protein [Nocardia donostiensis]ONM48189.1 hypothetical protein B0T46_14515 [Nocardia donostiensis]OQS13819.1 hypothetical protein B0T36_16865 [Nocardia donostiensis]OQS17695.1 hypothetical protein B0T44_23525 [Nocardia donostiensis]
MVQQLQQAVVRRHRIVLHYRGRAGETTEQPAHRPADLDLPTVWAEIVEQMEQRRATTAATALIAEGLLPILRDRQGRHCEVLGPAPDARIRVRLTAHAPRAIAEQLAAGAPISR